MNNTLKNIIASFAIIALGCISFISCEKDSTQNETNNTPSFKNNSGAIPYYATTTTMEEELERKINYKNQGPKALYEYEILHGCLSIGGLSDFFYWNTITDTLSYNTFLSITNSRSNLFNLTTIDGENYCLPKFTKSPLRYIADTNGYFQIGSTVTRIFEEGTVSTDISHISNLRNLYSYYEALNDTVTFLCFPIIEEDLPNAINSTESTDNKSSVATYPTNLEQLFDWPSWISLESNEGHENHLKYVNKKEKQTSGRYRVELELFYNTFFEFELGTIYKWETAYVSAVSLKKRWTQMWTLEPTNMHLHLSLLSCVGNLGITSLIDITTPCSCYERVLYQAKVRGLFTRSKNYVHFRASHSSLTSDNVSNGCDLIWGEQTYVH